MATWIAAIGLTLGAHFVMTFNVPAGPGRAWFGWPFAVGDRGVLGIVGGRTRGVIGPVLSGLAAAGFVTAILAIFGIWAPRSWWRPAAVGSALVSLLLMASFLRPNKALAIGVDLAVISIAAATWAAP